MMPSLQGVHILIPRTYDYFISDDKRDVTDVIKLRILSWRNYAGLSKWAQAQLPGSLEVEEGGGESQRRCDNRNEIRTVLLALQVEPQAKECGHVLAGRADGFSSSILKGL